MNSKFKNLFIAILTVVVLVGIAFTSNAQYSVSISDHHGKSRVKVNNPINDYKVEYEGEFILSDDDTDIISIIGGGYFEIVKSSFGASRRVRIETDGNQLIKRYYVGWSERDFEPEGQKWLAEVLPDLVRTTTIAAEQRVNRIYNKHGVPGLIRELDLLRGDYVSKAYYSYIFKKDLKDQDLAQLLRSAGQTINSDYYLATLLGEYQKEIGLKETTIGPFIEATVNIGSDHYQTNVLVSLAENDNLKGDHLSKAIGGARSIQSDHYKSQVVKAFNKRTLTPQQLNLLLKESEDIQSDHYLSNALIEIIKKQSLTSAGVSHVVKAAGHISSDVYLRNVYEALFKHTDLSKQDLAVILESADAIGSDSYLSSLLTQVLQDQRDSETLQNVFKLAANAIGSDHYLSEVLKLAMKRQELKGAVMTSFVTAMEELSSGHYSLNVIREAQNINLQEGELIQLVNACSSVTSDHYLTECLLALSAQVNRSGAKPKEAYRAAAKRISSDTYYGKAMKALDY